MTVTRSDLQLREKYVYFPEEIFFLIFSWLPLHSLLQCKIVCKDWYRYWNSIIRNRSFVKLHHSRLNQYHPDFLVLNFHNNVHDISQYFMLNCEGLENRDNSLEAKNLDYHLATEEQCIIIGSSNGLICLMEISNCENFYVINPVTKETLKLPKVLNHSKSAMRTSFCGFAYDEAASTYKVLRTWLYNPWVKGVEVCTLGSGIWRKKESARGIPHCPLPRTSQVLLNGSLHWMPCRKLYRSLLISELFINDHEIFDKPIVVFDISSEKLTTFGMPPDSGPDHTLDRMFSLLGNSLCVADDNTAGEIVVWIMKDYGVKESWTREHVIKKDWLGPLKCSAVKFLGSKKNGNVLLYSTDDHGYFDLEKGTFTRVLVHGIPKGSNQFGATFHVGSLISPKSIGT